MDWKEIEKEYVKDLDQRMEAMSPEPLFETYGFNGVHLCLMCAEKVAESVLWGGGRCVVPMCADCASDWRFYDYQALKKIKPFPLIKKVLLYKLKNLFSRPSVFAIFADIKEMMKWSKKMARLMGRKK